MRHSRPRKLLNQPHPRIPNQRITRLQPRPTMQISPLSALELNQQPVSSQFNIGSPFCITDTEQKIQSVQPLLNHTTILLTRICKLPRRLEGLLTPNPASVGLVVTKVDGFQKHLLKGKRDFITVSTITLDSVISAKSMSMTMHVRIVQRKDSHAQAVSLVSILNQILLVRHTNGQ
jgi:hypothetical protein